MIITKYKLIYKLKENENLLINTLSGAVDIVDDVTRKAIENNEILDDKETVDKLIKRKYILKDEKEEEELFNSFKKYQNFIECGVEGVRRSGFVICPTYNCNLRCTYCFQSHKMHRLDDVMTEEQVDKAFKMMENQILPYMNAEDFVIQLFGGEPLLLKTKNIVKYIFDKSKKNNTKITITTNGTNIEEFMDIFTDNKDRVSFQITLDSIKEIHDKRRIQANGQGTFDCIVKNIQLLLDNDFEVRVRANTSVDTVQYIPKLVQLFEEYDWCSKEKFKCILAPVSEHNAMPTCSTTDEFEIFEEIYKLYPNIGSLKEKYKVNLGADMYRIVGHLNRILKPNIVPKKSLPSIVYCESALLKMFFFGPDGYIYPCAETIGQKEFAIASFEPEEKIFKEKIEQWKNRTIYEMDDCKKCNVATFCGGGCPYASLKFNGNARKPFCGNTKLTIKKYVENIIE